MTYLFDYVHDWFVGHVLTSLTARLVDKLDVSVHDPDVLGASHHGVLSLVSGWLSRVSPRQRIDLGQVKSDCVRIWQIWLLRHWAEADSKVAYN